jgi:hypothetical protein
MLGIALAVAALAAATGCGGDDDGGSDRAARPTGEKGRVLDAVAAYGKAIADEDADAACDVLTDKARDAASQAVPGTTTCEAAHRQIMAILKDEDRKKFGDQLGGDTELSVQISGETAQAFRPPNTAQSLPLRRVDGEWKLDKNPLYFNRK